MPFLGAFTVRILVQGNERSPFRIVTKFRDAEVDTDGIFDIDIVYRRVLRIVWVVFDHDADCPVTRFLLFRRTSLMSASLGNGR